jgi:hypothetical protein
MLRAWKLASALVNILPEKGTRRPRKFSLCTSRVPPSAALSAKLCSPPMMPGRLEPTPGR